MIAGVADHLDVLHVILITGFCSFASAIATHVLTKYKLSETFLPSTEFMKAVDSLQRSQDAVLDKMMAHCELMRGRCPFGEMVEDVKDIKEELKEIKAVQKRRTEDLMRRYSKDNEVWRVIMSKLLVPIEEQNRLLSGGF
jgi:septation ring formation regulator EzrA